MADDIPVLKVDVDDDAFQNFLKAFADYSNKLKEQPAAWRRLNDALKKAGLSISGAASAGAAGLSQSESAAKHLARYLDAASKSQRRFAQETGRASHTMDLLHKSVRGVAHGVASLAKVAGILSGVGAVAGLGGLLVGIPDLADHVMRRNLSAKGLGVSVGKQSAFETFMRPYVPNAHGFLEGVAAAQRSQTGTVGMSILTGKSYGQVQKEPVNQLAVQVVESAQRYFQRYGKANTEAMLKATNLSSVLPLQTLITLQNSNRSRLLAAGRNALSPSQIHSLGWNRNASVSLQQFAVQLHRAGQMIEADFVRRLSDLGPALTRFSNAVAGDVIELINKVMTPANLQKAKQGMESLAKFLGSKKFHDDIERFVSAMGDIVSFVEWVAKHVPHFRASGYDNHAGNTKVEGAVGSHLRWNPKTGKYEWKSPRDKWEFNHPHANPSSYQAPHPAYRGTIDRTSNAEILNVMREISRKIGHEAPGMIKTQSSDTAARPAASSYAAGGH